MFLLQRRREGIRAPRAPQWVRHRLGTPAISSSSRARSRSRSRSRSRRPASAPARARAPSVSRNEIVHLVEPDV